MAQKVTEKKKLSLAMTIEDFGAGVRRGKLYAKVFDGCRHDSGNPYTWGEMLIAHYKTLKIDKGAAASPHPLGCG